MDIVRKVLTKCVNNCEAPIGYSFIEKPIISEILVKSSYSKFHNSNSYSVGFYYKPISLIKIVDNNGEERLL